MEMQNSNRTFAHYFREFSFINKTFGNVFHTKNVLLTLDIWKLI
jgi:hypothetical protein